MANFITWLKDRKKQNIIVPKTMTKAVYDDNGVALDSTLNEINSNLGGLAFESRKVAKTRSGDQFPQVIQVVVANAKNKAIFITPDTGNTAKVPNIIKIDKYDNIINIVFDEALVADTTYYLDMLIIG